MDKERIVFRDVNYAPEAWEQSMGRSSRIDPGPESNWDDIPVKAQEEFETKEQVLERQRKERLTQHLGKKQARWR